MKEKGFTLLELLLVVAILGLLATVVFASLNGLKLKAKNTHTINSIRQFIIWQEEFYLVNKQYLDRDCNVPGFACTICDDSSHPAWDWPPSSLGTEPDPFANGIPSLVSCLVYSPFPLSGNSQEYWLNFYLYNLGDPNLIDTTWLDKINSEIAPMIPNGSIHAGEPCIYFDEEKIFCFFRVIGS